MNDVFQPASAPDFARDERHWIAAGPAQPITHPEPISPIITRFLTDSAAYLGVNRECARANAGDEPKAACRA